MTYDIAIIGAGPGGYVAAIHAAKLGQKVVLVERDNMGGTCLNRGCIPTKALIASAHALELTKHAKNFGVLFSSDSLKINMQAAVGRKNNIVLQLRGGIEKLLKASGVQVLKGTASFDKNSVLKIDDTILDAKKIIIATGSSWIDLPGITPDKKTIVTTDEALDWTEIPNSLVIVGGGVVGCEFACMMSAFGSKVTIIEATDSILPPVEKAISRLLARSMKKAGIEILVNTLVSSAKIDGNKVEYTLSSGETKQADKMLVAVGRRPNTKNLKLENASVELDEKGFIRVNDNFQTSNENIYAIGDVIGFPMLAHAASAEAIAVVDIMLSAVLAPCPLPPDPAFCPSPIFTSPEIGCVGQTSEELTKKGIEFKTGRFSYAANGKAMCDGLTDGQILVHADKNGKVLGVHAIGENASLIISEATLAITCGLNIKDITKTIHAHPTLSEIFHEAAEDVLGMAIHKG